MTCQDCGGPTPSSRHRLCPACAKVRRIGHVRKWNEKNKDKMREYARQYHAARKEHVAERTRKWRTANADKELERKRRRHEEDPGLGSAYTRKSKYGIDRKQFEALVVVQNGRCAICQSTSPGPKNWHVDHDHRFDSRDPQGHRGLLCKSCNIGLGAFKDNIGVMNDAIDYLTAHAFRIRRAARSAA